MSSGGSFAIFQEASSGAGSQRLRVACLGSSVVPGPGAVHQPKSGGQASGPRCLQHPGSEEVSAGQACLGGQPGKDPGTGAQEKGQAGGQKVVGRE